MIKNISVAIFLCLISLPSFSQTMFQCGGNSGYSYFFEGSIVNSSSAGWDTDGTSKGKYSLVGKQDQLDLLFVDATGQIISAVADGGTVILLGQGNGTATILVNYPNQVAELYYFNLKTKKYSLNQIKYGESPIHKSSAFVGDCY